MAHITVSGDPCLIKFHQWRELQLAQHSDRNPFLPTRLIGHLTLRLEAIMDTVLFTDQGILVFVITGSIAVVLSVLGLATTHQTRTDIEHQLKG